MALIAATPFRAAARSDDTAAALVANESPGDGEVDQADDQDDEEQDPRERGGAAEVELAPADVVEVQRDRQPLLVGAAVRRCWSYMRGSSKICSPPIVDVMMTKMSVGRSDGSVMLQNWRNAFAPSTVAAS